VPATNKQRILRMPEVCDRLGVSRTTVWRMSRQGKLPRPIKIGSSSGWLEADIDKIIDAAIAERDRRAA